MTTYPVCLTIAGSDSGGGAGIQADLKTFAYFRVFGASVITCVTAQNPLTVTAIHPLPVSAIAGQFQTVAREISLHAIKTGMLYSSAIITAVAADIKQLSSGEPLVPCWAASAMKNETILVRPEPQFGMRRAALVVDPVMIATSGSRLAADDSVHALVTNLIPLATLVTPNLHEAETLLNRSLPEPGMLPMAAEELTQLLGVPVLLKGGHVPGDLVRDYLADGKSIHELQTPFVKAATTHGTGCTLSAAIAANLALGKSLADAVRISRAFIYGALCAAQTIGPRVAALGIPEAVHESDVCVTVLRR